METAPIELAELHSALAGTRVTLVTPNRRLAAWHHRQFAAAQQAAGLRAWLTPDILPFPAFIERSWHVCGQHGEQPPARLLDAPQECLLWEQVIREADPALAEGLLNVAMAARQAAAAWALASAWQLLPAMQKFAFEGDAALFRNWAQRFRERCRNRSLISVAELPDALATSIGNMPAGSAALPARLLVAGFDIVTPQQHHLWRILREAGVAVEAIELPAREGCKPAVRHEFAAAQAELRACAAWARDRLERDPLARIGIVVPDLEARREQVIRQLTDALDPLARASAAGETDHVSALFNVSLGRPLADYALVRDALLVLDCTLGRPLPFLDFSALLRSPYLGGADDERLERAGLDARLREEGTSQLTFAALRAKLVGAGSLRGVAECCPQFLRLLDRVHAGVESTTRQAPATASPQEWSRRFGAWLGAWGFPGERALDSTEFQVHAKLRDAFSALAMLEVVQPRMRGAEALAQLRRIAADTLFQPESLNRGGAPIEVLGILESAGQGFDALWVCGLSDAAWPRAARPHPFIPATLQCSAGVPEASAAASLALDRRVTQGWLRLCGEVVFSHPRCENADEEVSREASALIRDVALAPPARLAGDFDLAGALQAIGRREPLVDALPPALPNSTHVRGGANVVRDQAACPFRAFARHRLGARTLAVPEAGPTAMQRGNLLHRVLFLLWGRIGDHATLAGMEADALQAAVSELVARAIDEARAQGTSLEGRYARIEHRRLCLLLTRWLDYERSRRPFAVVEREALRNVALGGLRMDLRLDRLDRLDDGSHVLIDYKTGAAKMSSWLGARPDEPQLPLYAHTASELIAALAFARVRRGQPRKVFGFEGVSVVDGLLPDVGAAETRAAVRKLGFQSWDQLAKAWGETLQRLAADFAMGSAPVDPKAAGQTCGQCDLQGLCRIAEIGRYAALDADLARVEDDDAAD
ncbi:MAG TPA: PD-(D/E)XK nuclease family protein [Usitatibacteraceae bacterium]|nr:PD-(D/E)XK nuclease family protein [Usitatibacteraceae bacterium]